METSEVNKNIDYIKAWDGLRGFFTIFVVLSHLNILHNAWIVIGFFFGHSGILITSMSFNILEKRGEMNLMIFYHRRIARIIPGAFLVIFVICLYIGFIITVYPNEMSGIEIFWQRSDMLWALFYGSNWQLIFKGEDYFAQYRNLTLLRHFWSLAIEEQYYIVWPILLFVWMHIIPVIIEKFNNYYYYYKQPQKSILNKTSSTFYSLIIAVLVGDLFVLLLSSGYQYYMMQAKTPQYVIYYSTIIHLKEFALGGAGAAIVRLIPSLQGLMHSQHPYIPKYSFYQRIFIEVCITILMGYPLYLVTLADWKHDEEVFKWYFNYGIFPPLVVVITDILLAIQAKEMIEEEYYYFPMSRLFLSSDLIVYLGRISYQTYLWHVPIIIWTNSACKEGMNTECLTNAVFIVAFIYAFSAMISRFFEFPMQAYILSFKNPTKVVAWLFITMFALAGLICFVTRSYEDPYAYVEKEKSVELFDDDSIPMSYYNSSQTLSAITKRMFENINKSTDHYDNDYGTYFIPEFHARHNNKPVNNHHKINSVNSINTLGSLVKHHAKFHYYNKHKRGLFIFISSSIHTCKEVVKRYHSIKDHHVDLVKYMLYIYRNDSYCKSIPYMTNTSENFVTFNLDGMLPGKEYLKVIYHPSNAIELFNANSHLSSTEIDYLNRIIIGHVVTLLPATINYFKPTVFDNIDIIYQNAQKNRSISNASMLQSSAVFRLMMKNLAIKAHNSYQVIFLLERIAQSSFQSMVKNVMLLKTTKNLQETTYQRFLFVLSSGAQVCNILQEEYEYIKNHLNKFLQHHILYIHRTSANCTNIPQITNTSENFVVFNLDDMLPGRPFLAELHHPIYADTLFYSSPNMSLAEINYLNRIIIDHVVTLQPVTINYFKPSAFDNFDMIYKDVIDFKTELEQSKSSIRVAYLGNSIAERFGYLVNHMRDKILSSCKTYLNEIDNSERNKIKVLLLEVLSMFAIRQKGRPAYNIILDILSDKSELDITKGYIRQQNVSMVIVEDSNYIKNILYSRYVVQPKIMLHKVSVDSYVRRLEIFNRLLLFLDMLQSIGVKRVYLHDANNLNTITTDVFMHLGKKNFTTDLELGYRTILSYLEWNFLTCEKRTQALNESNLCVGNSKLQSLRDMLHVIDVSYLICPKRTVNTRQEIVCSRAAWGYNPILSDGEHPGGEAGEFLAANILSQITQDFYVDVISKSSLSKNNNTISNYRIINSSLALYTMSEQLSLCNMKNIKIIT